jgi:GNAT superfamily N-acetyltransferase
MVLLWSDAESGVQVTRMSTPEEAEALVCLFEQIARAESWQPGGALRRWPNRSVYFALEVAGQLAGGLQLVLPDPFGALPCQAIWPEVPAGSSRSAHVAILALDEAFRGRGILFWHLVIEMWRYCVGVGIATLYLEVTPRVLPLYHRLGWPLELQGELRIHWGEPCFLTALGIPEVAEALLRRAEHSPYYREIIAQAFRVTLPIGSVEKRPRPVSQSSRRSQATAPGKTGLLLEEPPHVLNGDH